ncbi:MAG: AAA family ATPase [Pseudomonadota bacterium]
MTVAANEFQAHCVQAKSTWTSSYMAETIMRELGLKETRGVARMVDMIGGQLAKTARPLIIDDAQYLLKKGMVDVVRDIYESCQTPVILVGEEKLPQDLTKWENVHNRMLAWTAALPCNMSDANHLAPIYCPDVAVEEDLLQVIVAAASGSIRRVATNLARVKEFCRQRNIRSVSMSQWGDRSFDTGQPPQRPRDQQALASPQVVPFTRKKAASK